MEIRVLPSRPRGCFLGKSSARGFNTAFRCNRLDLYGIILVPGIKMGQAPAFKNAGQLAAGGGSRPVEAATAAQPPQGHARCLRRAAGGGAIAAPGGAGGRMAREARTRRRRKRGGLELRGTDLQRGRRSRRGQQQGRPGSSGRRSRYGTARRARLPTARAGSLSGAGGEERRSAPLGRARGRLGRAEAPPAAPAPMHWTWHA